MFFKLHLPVSIVLTLGTLTQSSTSPAILDLIYRQRYDDAITKLKEVLERDPKNPEALTYTATANLYLHRNFTTALEDFQDAFKAGGGAALC